MALDKNEMTRGQDCVRLNKKSSAMSVIKRAETADEKIAKGEFILTAAHDMIARDGVQGLSMNKLCAACDVGKGTLYLYFKTRTEILAALYVQKLDQWCSSLEISATMPMQYDEFCRAYLAALSADPILVDLLIVAAQDFETELPADTYAETLTHLKQSLERQSNQFTQALQIDAAQASPLVWAFYTAAMGASAYRVRQDLTLPKSSDLGPFRAALQFDRLFWNAVSLYRTR